MLRLSEAASRLGISPATLRSYCDRGLVQYREMPNGERRFESEWLDSFRESTGSGSRRSLSLEAEAAESEPTERTRHRPRWKERVPPWERKALAAESDIKIERARQEVERLRAEEEARRGDVERARQTREAERREEARLIGLKQAGRVAIPWYPAELQRSILREVDDWVTSRNVPAYLSPFEQRNLVTAFVMEKSGAFIAERAAQAARETAERAQREKAKGETERIERESNAKAQAASCQRAAEDRQLDEMEAAYENRRALIGLARVLKR